MKYSHLKLDNKNGDWCQLCHKHHNRSYISHTPHQSLRQRDEPSWQQSLEKEALQNAAGEDRQQGQDT